MKLVRTLRLHAPSSFRSVAAGKSSSLSRDVPDVKSAAPGEVVGRVELAGELIGVLPPPGELGIIMKEAFSPRLGEGGDRGDEAGGIRVIVGNDTAVEAARTGLTNPWPEGSMIAHYVWGDGEIPNTADMVGPAEFRALTLMVKDSDAYAEVVFLGISWFIVR